MDSEQSKKRFFLSHKKSSALVVSVIIHAVFIVVAITFVAVQVYIKPEKTFEVVDVNRPKMKLRKLQVPVKQQKKAQAPKLRKMIVTKKKTSIDIQMPEIVGIKGGTGYGNGGGLGGLGFGFDMDLFGGSGGKGNELIGTFYDLKQTPDGELSEIGEMVASGQGDIYGAYFDVVDAFLTSSWNVRRLADYFQAPRKKYATAIMIPQMEAEEAPKAFNVQDQVQPKFWVAHYKGEIAAPETGTYRFWGFGDDVLAVRIGKKLVLNGSMPWCAGNVSDWESDHDENHKFLIGNYAKYTLAVGDWFPLRKGQRVNMEVLIGEVPGVMFGQYLLIEQQGKEYRKVQTDKGLRMVLPVFKTADIPDQLATQMKINPNQATLNGPVFGALTNTQ